MKPSPEPFTFANQPPAGDRVVVVPAAVTTQSSLLAWYAQALSFPGYVGHNWDALHECLRDLGWLTERRIVIAHCDVPLAHDARSAAAYLALLHDARQHWQTTRDAAHTLEITFPESVRAAVLRRLPATP